MKILQLLQLQFTICFFYKIAKYSYRYRPSLLADGYVKLALC